MKIFIMLILIIMNNALAENVIYKDGKQELEGFIAYPFKLSSKSKLPAILMIPAWKGLDDYHKSIAKRFAKKGYITLAVDMYGKGVRAKNNDEARELATKYRSDRKLMRQRVQAALDYLKKDSRVDVSRIAIVGYCFGGGVALELARSGAPIKGAISFHGNLDTPNAADAKNIKAKILVLHGAIDPSVSKDQLLAFMQEMNDAKVDYQLVAFGGAVHAFTDEKAGSDITKGVAYNANASHRAYQIAFDFLKEIFQK